MTQGASVNEHSRRGEVIAGKYRIEKVLGIGGMGIVFAATHLDLDRLVALKIMRTELTQFPGAVERLLLEAKLAARLRSEHVCRVLDVGTLSEGVPFVVMEYLEGSDLASQLAQRGPFETSLAVDLILQACEALAEAHVNQIVHRDLKPENLFMADQLDDSPEIKVLDFGISKQGGGSVRSSRALTNPSSTLGSPNYMPPEQMLSAKDVDVRADIWAIGAILYELLTDSPAFDGESVPEVCAAVLSMPPANVAQLRPDLPEGLAGAVMRCLEKNRDDRFANVAELAGALVPYGSPEAALSLARIQRVLAGRPATIKTTPSDPVLRASASSTPSSPRPRVDVAPSLSPTLTTGAAVTFSDAPKRRSWLLIAAAVVIVGGLGFLVTFALLGRRGSTEPSAASIPSSSAAVLSEPSVAVALAGPASPSANPSPSPRTPVEAPPSASVSTSPAMPTAAPVARSGHPTGRKASATLPKPAPAATPKDAKTGAWDTGTFGPRQ